MLHDTLKALRKQKGYSQEEVAARINVVRQTVSKWEKGLSVPDADALMRIAELYEVSVSDLLGAPPAEPESEKAAPDFSGITEQLSRINEQLVIRNRRSARIWKIVGAVVLGWIVIWLLNIIFAVSAFSFFNTSIVTEESITLNEFAETIDTVLP